MPGANSAMEKQLIMGKEDVLLVHQKAPSAQLIATHMEAENTGYFRERIESICQEEWFFR